MSDIKISLADYYCKTCDCILHTDRERDFICAKCNKPLILIEKSWWEGSYPNQEQKRWVLEKKKDDE